MPTELEMTFDPKVVQHLGTKMYSTLPPVLSELIANAYDADATEVEVELYDQGEKKIVVKDNGIGMSENDIRTKFLVVGRNRRDTKDAQTSKRRKPIGKKGLGKLSFFGVVKIIEVETVKDEQKNTFVMNWVDMLKSKGSYKVEHKVENKSIKRGNGTTITLKNIERKSPFDPQDIANSISRFFIVDKDFSIYVNHNNQGKIKVTNAMRFDSLDIQFKWTLPDDLKEEEEVFHYLKEFGISGDVMTNKKPLTSKTNTSGITLFSRRKLVQAPYHFAGGRTSSHFYSYLTGLLEVDFIDDLDEDVIATSRQSLNWEHSEMSRLRSNLRKCMRHLEKDWRKKRKEVREEQVDKEAPAEWFDSMPEGLRGKVKKLLVEAEDSIGEEEMKNILGQLLEIIPVYPLYHWRNLHKKLQQPLFKYYKSESYLRAADQGQKIYQKQVQKKSKIDDIDGEILFNQVFGKGKILKIEHPFEGSKNDANIQRGQYSLSAGMIQSFRNLDAHHFEGDFQEFFNEKDCLDFLSLISFLLSRVDKAKKLPETEEND